MDDRITELEIKVAHQELALEELKKLTFDQSLIIEKLEKSLKKLGEVVDSTQAPAVGPGNEKPPHY